MAEPEIVQWHVTWSTKGRRPIAPDEARRRALVRMLADRAAPVLVLFSVVDDRVHVWLMGSEKELVAMVRSLGYALRTIAAAPLDAPFIEPVEKRSHGESLVPYLLTQTEHHGIATHPAMWAGAPLPDLLGARLLEPWRPIALLWEALPRLRVGDIHAAVGLPDMRLVPASDAEIRALGAGALVAAAGGAFAAGPALTKRDAACISAIAAAASLARDAGLSLTEVASLVGRSRESVTRAAGRPLPAAALKAVRLRIALDRVAVGAIVPPVSEWKKRLARRRAESRGNAAPPWRVEEPAGRWTSPSDATSEFLP